MMMGGGLAKPVRKVQVSAQERTELRLFLSQHKHPIAQEYLARKTASLSSIHKLILECSDSRATFSSSSPDAITFCTAGQALTDATIQEIKRRFPTLNTVEVHGHTFCGGCHARATLENGKADELTPELQTLTRTMISSDEQTNALHLASRWRSTGSLEVQSYYSRIQDGVSMQLTGTVGACEAKETSRKQPYSPVTPDGWDMRLGQNPRFIVLSLGLQYAPLEFIAGTSLDAPNQIYEVSVPLLDAVAVGSLQYALLHAMQHTENAQGCSFNETKTMLVIMPHDGKSEADQVARTLCSNPAYQTFTGEHPHGQRGSAYVLLHRHGVIGEWADMSPDGLKWHSVDEINPVL